MGNSVAVMNYQEPTEAESRGGILVVDKPEGLTSAWAAARVKKALRPRKIGHTGTLDPFATGVLVLCLDEATRVADQIINLEKVYRAILRFGAETDTLDRTGTVIRTSDLLFSKDELSDVLSSFQGECVQKVPRFSAVKVAGRRLYELSRKGIEVEQPEREICIHSIALHDFAWPEATIEVRCSKGTYIRQLACDIGQKLGSAAHLSALRRISVGPFQVDQALSMDDLSSVECIVGRIIPPSEALSHLPCAVIAEQRILERLRNGHLDHEWEEKQISTFSSYAGAVRIVTESNRLAALWWPNSVEPGSRRLRVFPF
jgi:tRNA pseudouridine55 synthase